MLGKAGFEQYEVSNYARPGFESVHNRAYWSGQDYLGLGPSAVSTVGLRRWQNISDYRAYADRILGGESASTGDEVLTPADEAGGSDRALVADEPRAFPRSGSKIGLTK